MHENMPIVNLENTVFFLKETKQLHWVNYLRALAIVFIVGFHMLYAVTGSLKFSYGFLGAILESGTMTFVFVAGFLFQYRRKEDFNYKRYIYRRFQIVFLPYLIATALLLTWKFVKTRTFDWQEILPAFLFGQAAPPLWFIPMIMLFCLLAPLFIWIDRKKLYWISIVLLIFPFIWGRGGYLELGKNIMFFLPFFILGIWYAAAYDRIVPLMDRLRFYIWGGTLICLALTFIFPENGFIQTMTKMFVGAGLLVFLQDYTLHISTNGASFKIFSAISNASLGIYFYHNSLLGLFAKRGWERCQGFASEPTAILYCLLGTLFCIGVLMAGLNVGAWILRKCGIINTRSLIGR